MNYALIGSGNIAWFLADALTRAGHTCTGLYARNAIKGSALAKAYNLPVYESLTTLQNGMDACIIAVPDGAVKEVAAQLSLHTTTLLHTAGTVPLDVLSGGAAHYGVLWPVYSILRDELPQHRNFPVAYDGNTEVACKIAKALAGSLSDLPMQLDGQQRSGLHLAAVMGNNFTNHLLAIAMLLSKTYSLPLPALLPIIRQTFERLDKGGSVNLLQTGPALRRDAATMKSHISMLETQPEWQSVYTAISASIQHLYPLTES